MTPEEFENRLNALREAHGPAHASAVSMAFRSSRLAGMIVNAQSQAQQTVAAIVLAQIMGDALALITAAYGLDGDQAAEDAQALIDAANRSAAH